MSVKTNQNEALLDMTLILMVLILTVGHVGNFVSVLCPSSQVWLCELFRWKVQLPFCLPQDHML